MTLSKFSHLTQNPSICPHRVERTFIFWVPVSAGHEVRGNSKQDPVFTGKVKTTFSISHFSLQGHRQQAGPAQLLFSVSEAFPAPAQSRPLY